MTAEIICVGTELLLGNIVNTNAAYLAEKLAGAGLDCYYQTVVGDNVERLAGVLKCAMERSDVILLSGGLGPTEDDLTKISRQLDVSMGDMFQVINVFAIVMFALLVYLLIKLIIEKNTISISMVKILGYDNREIGKLYLTATTWVVVCSIAVSIPLSYLLIELIYRSMMADFHGWLMMYVAPKVYGEMFVLGLIVYFVVAFFQMARIRKIPMDEALKNVE